MLPHGEDRKEARHEMKKQKHVSARRILQKCLDSCGMGEYAGRIEFVGRDGSTNAHYLSYYYEHPAGDVALCQIVRGLLFDQIPELYQTLK